ncbi:MAG: hypothetical protein Q9220_005381 [cf. Caloplaca sp. 1 TL-2023]
MPDSYTKNRQYCNMEAFSLRISKESVVTGLRTPALSGEPQKDTPLIVAIHGGSYSAAYYDVGQNNSAAPCSAFFGVPFIAIDRPGYLDSTPLPAPIPEDSSYCQEEGKYLHNEVLPAIWKMYSKEHPVSSIVILAHSLAVPMTIVAAALTAESSSKEPSYRLAGIILSGFGTTLSTETQEYMGPKLAESPQPDPDRIRFPTLLKDDIMLCGDSTGITSPEVFEHSERLNVTSCSQGEWTDGGYLWASYGKERYMQHVKCPVMYALAGEENLWVVNAETLDWFADSFKSSSRVDKGVIPGAPHCMELGRAGRGWYARVFGWAIECGVAFGLGKI